MYWIDNLCITYLFDGWLATQTGGNHISQHE